MAFDIKTARPVVLNEPPGLSIPADPLKQKTGLADLALKYQQIEKEKSAVAKANKPPPTYEEVAGGAAAKAEGQAIGRDRAAARQNLPTAVAAAKATSAKIQQLLSHPGFSALVGMPNPFKGGLGVYTTPGSSARGAKTLFDQIKGTAFLAGVQAMRGTGPVSDREGKAAEAAIQRMSTSQSEDEFKQAAQEYVDAMERGIAAMREVSKLPATTVASPEKED